MAPHDMHNTSASYHHHLRPPGNVPLGGGNTTPTVLRRTPQLGPIAGAASHNAVVQQHSLTMAQPPPSPMTPQATPLNDVDIKPRSLR